MVSVLGQEPICYELYTIVLLSIMYQNRVRRNENFGNHLSNVDLCFNSKLVVL